MNIKCPQCGIIQSQEPTKSWNYGKMIEKRTSKGTVWGASIKCSQYYCECGNPFRFYLSTKGKSWTIPKSKNTKSSKSKN